GNSLLRFQRDTYGTQTIAQLSDEQKNSSASQMIDSLCSRYGINQQEYTPQHVLEIINLRLLMSANSYNRYISFTIANEVSDQTVAAILENSDELAGVTVEQQYIRKYVDSVYCSQILGYTGTVSTTELATLKEQNSSYENNDVVGKAGIEQSMEQELSGEKGSKTVYVDTVGRITEVLDETDPKAGNDVYLTIDIELQKKIYNAIEDELVSIISSNLTSGTTKYTYNASTGDINNIYITIPEVYFALIDNNLVSTSKIAQGNTENERDVYAAFQSKKEQIFDLLRSELTSSPTAYGQLSEEEQAYIWYIYKDLLKANGIFNSNNVDTNDSVYKDWTNGNSTSLEQLLRYSITKNWINMSDFTSEQYTSLDEAYNELVNYIFDVLETDADFHKKLYKYMIENGNISGRQVCMMLFEQGFLQGDDDYQALSSGRISAYDFMSSCISSKRITPAQLALQPCSGSCVITDPNNGNVLALVSYPSYDNNRMSGTIDADYYKQLNNDKSNPLYNWATQAQNAPGSTYKVCTSIMALDMGIINPSTSFYCSGTFDKITPSPRCWVRSGHGTETVTTAIRDSCNLFFYNVGYNLALSNGLFDNTYATSVMQKYAEELGLATMSGIEIAEKAPSASNIDAVYSAIGQGNHAYSTLNLARYVTTVANSGTCYNLTLIDKITDNNGNLIRDNSAEVANVMNISQSIWDTVHYGMNLVVNTYSALSKVNLNFAAKSGTAQENKKEPDHAMMISYAPYDNPQIAMAVSIPHGYSGSQASELTAKVLNLYFGLE
ncbi:MAG: penicillin-binding protein, partial [Lachnospira sp.]|nr:penicillin-binding protein [Lachnospira sp.]